MTKRIFRTILTLYVILIILILAKILFIGPGTIPEPAAIYYTWWTQQPQSVLEMAVGWLGLMVVVISILSTIAMFAFLPWGRPVFIGSIALMIVGEGLMDLPVLKTPSEYVLDSIAGILSGLIIAIVYWSPVSDAFISKRNRE